MLELRFFTRLLFLSEPLDRPKNLPRHVHRRSGTLKSLEWIVRWK